MRCSTSKSSWTCRNCTGVTHCRPWAIESSERVLVDMDRTRLTTEEVPTWHYFARAPSLHPGLSFIQDDWRFKEIQTLQSTFSQCWVVMCSSRPFSSAEISLAMWEYFFIVLQLIYVWSVFMTIHYIAVEIFQCGPKRRTDWQTNVNIHTARRANGTENMATTSISQHVSSAHYWWWSSASIQHEIPGVST